MRPGARGGRLAGREALLRPSFTVGCALALALGSPALAQDVALPPPGGEAWRAVTLRGVDRPTRYATRSIEGVEAVRAESECGASGLALPLGDVDLTRTPRLRWRWRAETLPSVGDERTRAGDDFAARVYVTFALDARRASLFQRLRHRAASLLYDDPLPGSALAYVWSAKSEPGASWRSPFTRSSGMIALARGSSDAWRSEDVDVLGDYAALFGRPPPRPLALAIMTDADGSCSRAAAWYADFRLAAGAPEPEGRTPGPPRHPSRR